MANPNTHRDADDVSTDMQDNGRWNQFVGKAKEMYGDAVGDGTTSFKGNFQQALGYIQEETGDAMETVKEKLGWDDDDRSDRKAA